MEPQDQISREAAIVRLEVAAPDLLEACRTLVDWVETGREDLSDPSVGLYSNPDYCLLCQPGMPDDPRHVDDCPVVLAMAAIEKAEGS